jgi:hypothetical protein
MNYEYRIFGVKIRNIRCKMDNNNNLNNKHKIHFIRLEESRY